MEGHDIWTNDRLDAVDLGNFCHDSFMKDFGNTFSRDDFQQIFVGFFQHEF